MTGDADKEPTVSHTAPSAPSYSASVSMLSSTSSTSFSAMDEQSDGPQADLPSAPGFASTSSFHPHPQPQPHACLPLPRVRTPPPTHPHPQPHQVGLGEELPDGSFGYAFGRLRFVHYEARQLSETDDRSRSSFC